MVLRKGHGAGIEPAVDDLGDTVHLFAALGAADGHGVDEGTVQLNVLGAVVAHLPQFLDGTDGMALAAFTLPNVKGGAPVAVAAQAPILNILQPVPEAALADAFGDPVDGIVIADEVILHRRHLDEPALAGIVQQGGIAAPAEGIVMLKLRRIVQKPPAFQVHQHLGVGVLHKQPRKGGLLGHMALAVHKLHKGQVIAAAHLCVVLTKGGRNMHDAGTVTHGNIVGHRHIKALFLLLFGALGSAGEKRLVFLIFQRGTGHLLQHLVGGGVLGLQPSQYGIQKRLRHIVGAAVSGLHLAVGILGVDAQRHVARQRPGGGRPRQEVGVLALHLKAHDGTALLDGLIALCHLMAGKRGAAAGAVRHDLKALIQKPAVVNALERPPFTFDIIVIVGDIGVVHIRPKADGAGKIFPHALVFPHAFLAVRNKGLQPVLFYLVLAVQAQLLFHLQLYRQAVGIPAGLAGHHIALHGAVPGDHVLDDTGQHMPDMGLTVGRGGAIVKDIGRPLFAGLNALFKDMLLLPEGLYLLFLLHKVHIGRNALVHFVLAPFGFSVCGRAAYGPCAPAARQKLRRAALPLTGASPFSTGASLPAACLARHKFFPCPTVTAPIKKPPHPITGRSATHFVYKPPITPHRVCGSPLTGDGRRALLTARRSGFSSGVIFPHRRPALRSHRPQLALPLFGGTVSVTAFLYLRGYFSTVFPGLQPPHRYAIINPDYLTKRRNYHETGRSITGARRPQPPHRAAALPSGQ